MEMYVMNYSFIVYSQVLWCKFLWAKATQSCVCHNAEHESTIHYLVGK